MTTWRAVSLAVLAGALLAGGCSDWPPGERGEGSGGSSDSIPNGTCRGTPRPCSSLNGAQCEAMPGCDDNGVCSGAGITCGTERSFTGCESAVDCFWSSACSGAPVGCVAGNETACVAMPGCSWVPSGGGTGGSNAGPACPTLGVACSRDSQCDCDLRCVRLCTSCTSICAKRCSNDSDCANSGGQGVKTPYCVKQTTTATEGICGAVR